MGNLSALRSFSPSIDWSLYTGTWARSKQFFFQAYINTVRPDVRTLPRSWELAAVAATAVVAAVVLGIVAEQLRPRLAAAAGVAPVVVVVAAVAGLEPIRGSQRSSF